MFAFLRLDDGYLVKIYEYENDWEIIDSLGYKRWFTKWTDDKENSLKRAVNSFFENRSISVSLKDFEISK